MNTIAVIYGGASVEHDVSILTGLHCAKNVVDYNVVRLYLTRGNRLVTGRALSRPDFYISGQGKAKRAFISGGYLYTKKLFAKKICKLDAVINCCHGGVGEGGELAGYFATLGVPFTSCDYISASNLQSKSRTKEILGQNGFLQVKYIVISHSEYETEGADEIYKRVQDEVGMSVIVKPDTLGSSIGISLARNKEEFEGAIKLAFELDKKVIIEQFLENIAEINCSAYSARGEIFVSGCELITRDGELFDYECKYLNPASGFIKKGAHDNSIDSALQEEVQQLTRKAYEMFNCKGIVRADFMICEGKVYLNEINTVPGFLAYHLWLRAGVPYGVVLDDIIKEAITSSKNTSRTDFNSTILERNRALIED